MASVKTEVNQSASLTIHSVQGAITAKEIEEVLAEYYKGTITNLILWNFQASTFTQISIADLQMMARRAKNYGPLRPGGKTAFVFSQKVDYGLGRMHGTLCEINDNNISFMSFMDVASAFEWLGVSKDSQL